MFLYTYMSGGIGPRVSVGHQLQDFIKSCTFGGLECGNGYFGIFQHRWHYCHLSLLYVCETKYEITKLFRSFETLPTPSYGNCFVFNFNAGNPSLSTVLPGPGYGLSLVLNLEQEFYGGITEAAGARSSLSSSIAKNAYCMNVQSRLCISNTDISLGWQFILVQPHRSSMTGV